MKSLKKTLVLLVVLSMLLSAISPVFAANYFADDAQIDEAYWEYANKLAAVGVIKGDANNNFNATSNITRAEMAVIICKMAGMTEATANASKNVNSIFEDVPAGEWYTGWINLAVNNGMIAGFPDGTFRPNDPLTTNQAITLVVKALGKGAYVDKMGTWPGNYVQEAAKLGLTSEMVNTESDLANRGNVAILAWEALQVGTWDVTSTTLDGEVTLSESDSLLIKYFKDHVAGKGVKDNEYRVKLVEDAVVKATGKTTTDLGEYQIVLAADDDTKTSDDVQITKIADYIAAKTAPKKGAKTATYTSDAYDVVAYVPETVASVKDLANKRVDVLFGADNEVVLIYATEDVVDEAYVTSWNEADKKITIGGTTYRVNDTAEVSVFNKVILEAEATGAIDAITYLIEEDLEITKPSKVFNRALKADIVLDEKGRVSEINFTFSADGYNNTDGDTTIDIEEDVVKTITTSGMIKGFAGNIFAQNVEDLMDAELIRVIRDNEVADFDEIEKGDVITKVIFDKTLDTEETLVYVSSAKAKGEISAVKNYAVTIDGTAYNTILLPLVNADNEFDELAVSEVVGEERDIVYDYLNEDAEVYVNFVGEVVAILGDTAGTGEQLGIVTTVPDLRYDDNGIYYYSVKILTMDGKSAIYKIYNADDTEDVTKADDNGGLSFTDEDTLEGDLATANNIIVFSADANRVIASDEIEALDDAETYTFNGKTVKVKAYDDTEDLETNSDVDRKYIEDDSDNQYKYNGSSVTVDLAELEVVKAGWDAIIDDNGFAIDDNGTPADDSDDKGIEDILVFYDTADRIVYFVANFTGGYASTDEEYAVVTSLDYVTNSDGKKVWEATLYSDGATIVKELSSAVDHADYTEGDFVTFTVSNDKIDTMTLKAHRDGVAAAKEWADVEDHLVGSMLESSATSPTGIYKGQIVVAKVVDGDCIEFVDDATKENGDPVDADAEGNSAIVKDVYLCEDGYVIYDLRGTTPAMVDDINEIVGEHIVAYECEDACGADIIVILPND